MMYLVNLVVLVIFSNAQPLEWHKVRYLEMLHDVAMIQPRGFGLLIHAEDDV